MAVLVRLVGFVEMKWEVRVLRSLRLGGRQDKLGRSLRNSFVRADVRVVMDLGGDRLE